jgi:hypothetical protein
MPVTLYTGDFYDHNASVLVPNDDHLLSTIWCLASSPSFSTEVRRLDQSLKPSNRVFTQIPVDIRHWIQMARDKHPIGLPEPQSDDLTQWMFHGHPEAAEVSAVLHVAIARILDYRWPPELDPEIHLSDEARRWVIRCNSFAEHAAEDGIVCLSALRGEPSAGDRLRRLLADVFGTGWLPGKERQLLAATGDRNRQPAAIDEWLRDRFFEEHCKLFHNRPFVWHLCDGLRDGFHVLANAHKLTGPGGEGRRTLEALTYSHLGDWIARQQLDQQQDVEGADARLAAAQDLQRQLEHILEGEPPYDMVVRWKPLHEQAIGWDPDINDGIRINIRPFI